MKRTVVVIAHNEEAHIEDCIQSLLEQTLSADEIFVINHNSSDTTGERARKFPVKVVDYIGPAGSVYARIKGLEVASGDLILCIDGDAVAAPNWIETLAGLMQKEKLIMIGTWVRMTGLRLVQLASWRWYFICVSKGNRATDFMWGASFALCGDYTAYAIRALEKGRQFSEELGLQPNPDDYWLALYMNEVGGIQVTNKSWVKAYAKEKSAAEMIRRSLNAWSIRSKVHKFLKHSKLEQI